MADLTRYFGGQAFVPTNVVPLNPPPPPDEQARDAMRAAGIEPPRELIFDGKVHRFATDKRREKTGWYILFPDGIPAGRFGDWRTGADVPWRAEAGRELTDADHMAYTQRIREAQRARDAERERQHAVAAETVESIWASAAGAEEGHPYLARKGVLAHGIRITRDGRLVAPLYTEDGKLSSLQYIDHAGGKLYHPGGAVGGRFWVLGTFDEPGAVYVAEGFATAATVHEATGRPCVVSYSASNLVPVVGIWREKLGALAEIVIVADNDASGVGQRYAEQASAKFGARVVVPPELGDANDYRAAGGDLAALLAPPRSDLATRLGVVWASDLSDAYEAPDELVEGVMTLRSVSVLYGDSNSGKTFFALSIAAAVASGTPWHGRQVDGGLVVYLATESPASVRSRVQAIRKLTGLRLDRLAIVQVPVNFYTGPEDAANIVRLVQEVEEQRGERARLVIGDTLARISAGANENSGEDMAPVMARFDLVSQSTGAAVLIVHHTGKDAARGARGWSGIRAHIDTEIEVVESDGSRVATITKQRELAGKGDAFPFRLEIVEMGTSKFGSVATTCVAVPEELPDTPKVEVPKGLLAARQAWDAAWFSGGAEERGGLPYVSRSAMREHLERNMKGGAASKRTITNALDASRPEGVVGRLIGAGLITPTEHGWAMVDGRDASMLLMMKSGKV